MRTTLTILLTSLVWALAILFFFEPKSFEEATTPVVEAVEVAKVTPPPTKSQKRSENKSKRTESSAEKQVSKSAPAEAAKTTTEASKPATTESSKATATESTKAAETIDYAREIDGKWTPVEGAQYPLEITKYGVAIQDRGYKDRVKCILKGKKLSIKYDTARCEITKADGVYYLEIFNSRDFSGKYKRTSQPRKIAMRQLDSANYAELIVGKWSPINGQEHALEISKYGTAIQYRGYEDRVEYSLNGSSLKIKYDSASVVISEDASYYYLEIYNSEDFSGRYRKSK